MLLTPIARDDLALGSTKVEEEDLIWQSRCLNDNFRHNLCLEVIEKQ